MTKTICRFVFYVLLAVVGTGMCGCATQEPIRKYQKCKIQFAFDQRTWQVRSQSTNPQNSSTEYCLSNDLNTEPQESVTTSFSRSDQTQMNVPMIALIILQRLESECDEFQTNILVNQMDHVVFEFANTKNQFWPAQRQITSLMHGPDGLYTLFYHVDESAFSQSYYDGWKQRILNASVCSQPGGYADKIPMPVQLEQSIPFDGNFR